VVAGVTALLAAAAVARPLWHPPVEPSEPATGEPTAGGDDAPLAPDQPRPASSSG
jgi:hypothetical protein